MKKITSCQIIQVFLTDKKYKIKLEGDFLEFHGKKNKETKEVE